MSESLTVVQRDLVALLATRPGAVALPFGRDILLLACHVAGTGYQEIDEDRLRVGEELALRREPGNPHDGLAIRVQTGDGMVLGYVPRRCNEVPARLMDAGKLLVARLTGISDEDDWLRLDIQVLLREI